MRPRRQIKGASYRRRRQRARLAQQAIIILAGAGIIGGLVGAVSTLGPAAANPAASSASDCSVVDGDTLGCQGERIRLLGIDAPELPGHCRAGRSCAPGDPYASTKSLQRGLTGEIRIRRFGQDRYGRTLALVETAKGDLSCWQLRHGQAVYKPRWDDDLRVARSCPSALAR